MAAYIPPKPKKKTDASGGPAAQADAIEGKGQYTSGLSTKTEMSNHGSAGSGADAVSTLKSDTPQLDEQRKAKRIQTLTDEQVLAKAKDGYLDYSTEARRRKLPGYEKD